MKARAVIFDFDGVLVDTMPISIQQLRKILGKRGITFTDRQLYLLEGEGIRKIIAELMQKDQPDEEVDQVYEEKARMARGEYQQLKLWSQPLQIIKKLRQRGIPVGMASGSYREWVEQILGNQQGLFDAVITKNETEKAKPHPEPYLKAAEGLGLEPKQCLAVDNAPLGIRSAKQAGMTCLGITTTLGPHDLSEADYVVKDFQKLGELINHLTQES